MVAPASVALVGFLMFGNLLRECGVLNALSETAQNVLANLIKMCIRDSACGVSIPDEELAKLKTVGDIYNYITAHI